MVTLFGLEGSENDFTFNKRINPLLVLGAGENANMINQEVFLSAWLLHHKISSMVIFMQKYIDMESYQSIS